MNRLSKRSENSESKRKKKSYKSAKVSAHRKWILPTSSLEMPANLADPFVCSLMTERL